MICDLIGRKQMLKEQKCHNIANAFSGDIGGRGVERLGHPAAGKRPSVCNRVMPNETDQNERWDYADNRDRGRLPMVCGKLCELLKLDFRCSPIPLQ